MSVTALGLALALGAGGGRGGGGVQDTARADSLLVQTVRFHRGDRTLVNGFVRIPHRMLDGLSVGPGGFAEFRVEIVVAESGGNVLSRDSWTRRVAWEATRVAGAATVEPLAMSLAAGGGEYAVRVLVRDSASGRQAAASVRVTAYAGRPPASDLLLAQRIRRAAGADTAPAAGEIRKGDLFITSGPDLVLAPTAATLFYYGEVYRDSAETVPWSLRVMGQDGRVFVTTAPARAELEAGGGSLTGAIDVTGLPPGAYRLALMVGDGADTATRAAEFQVGGLELERRLAAAAGPDEAADLFAQATEPQLDSMFDPLLYLAEAGEMSVYPGLTVEGKRRFLRDFWRKRDLTPGTEENEARIGFYQRIVEANRRFREGGAAEVPGWRTDRGRVYIRYGEPDDVLRRPQAGPDRPWETWKYSRGRALRFVFLDQTRLGNYALIFTNDRLERSLPAWTSLLSAEAIREILNF